MTHIFFTLLRTFASVFHRNHACRSFPTLLTLLVCLSGCQTPESIGTPERRSPQEAEARAPQASPEPSPESSAPPTTTRKKHTTDLQTDPMVEGEVRVAVLAPLTGPHAAIGEAVISSAMLSLSESREEDFSLYFYDTAGDPWKTQEILPTVLQEHSPHLIVGPVFSECLEAIRNQVPTHVPILSLSNNTTLAKESVFVLGVDPEARIVRLVSYGRDLGLQKLALLAEEGDYGDLVLSVLRDVAEQEDVELLRVARLSMDGLNMQEAIAEISNYKERRQALVKLRATLSQEGPSAQRRLQKLARRTTLTPPDFTALVVAARRDRVRQLAAHLAYNDVRFPDVRILGIGDWNFSPFLQESALSHAWFATSPTELVEDFALRYHAMFDRTPAELSILTYDAIAMAISLWRQAREEYAAHLEKESAVAPTFALQRLTRAGGFYGVGGLFHLLPSGRVMRSLEVVEITREGMEVRDSAPGFLRDF